MVTWQGRYDQEMRGFADAIYRRWIYEAVMFAYIDIPHPTMIEIIVGYNPQRLLSYQPTTQRWGELHSDPLRDIQAFAREFMLGEKFNAFAKPIFPPIFPGRDFRDEYIDFGTGTGRRETPFVTPIGRVSYPHLKPPEVVTFSGADFAASEARLLAMMADPHVTSIYIDFADARGGDLPGRINFDEMLADARKTHYSRVPIVPIESDVKQNGRSAAYLKHDPSKKKGRRR